MSLMRNIIGFSLTLPTMPESESLSSRRKLLTNIIRHANTHCPYYKEKYTAFLEGERDFTDEEFGYAFSHLPIIDRRQLDTYNADFRSDELNSKEEIFNDGHPPSFMDFVKRGLLKKNFMASIALNGSSTRRWFDHHDAQFYAGSILHALNKNGWKRGQHFIAFMPENSYFTRTLSQCNSTLYHFFGLTVLPFENITKESVIQLLTALKNTKATALVTLPHALLRIAQIMYEENITPYEHLRYINISGSYFLDCKKTFIQTMFPGSDIQCSYGATECGMIAHQSLLSSFDYDVFDEYVYLEQGPGNSILVTTHHQKAFPLIRYKIEDMGRIINCHDGSQKIKSLEGHNSDYLIGADGYMYFPSFFNIFINEINKALNDPIIDFSLRHDDNNLELSFVLTDRAREKKIKKTVLEVLKPVFANYKHVTVSFPHHIEHNFSAKLKIIQRSDAPAQKLAGYKKFEQRQPRPVSEQNTMNSPIKRNTITLDKAPKKKAS